MSRTTIYLTIACLVLWIGVAAGGPPTFSYSQIDFPGAKSTSGSGLNARGDIVGFYVDQSNKTHGFLLKDGAFYTVDFPGAVGSQALGINSQGDIVGTRGSNFNIAQAGGDIHGFILRAGDSVPEPVDYPGHLNTIAQRINDRGQIYGCYHDHDNMASMFGFRLSQGDYTALDGSESGMNMPTTMNNGATPDGGIIVGLFTDMQANQGQGYVLDRSRFMPFIVPGSVSASAWDINPSREVVGAYNDHAGKAHGFILSRGEFTTLDYPGASATRPRGINPQGDVVGIYVDSSSKTHGFLLTRTGPHGE